VKLKKLYGTAKPEGEARAGTFDLDLLALKGLKGMLT